jgi:DNA repair protein RAD50
LQNNIQATQKKMDSLDLEGASKAKRNFEEKYQPEKDRENDMQQKVTYPSLPPRVSYSPR